MERMTGAEFAAHRHLIGLTLDEPPPSSAPIEAAAFVSRDPTVIKP